MDTLPLTQQIEQLIRRECFRPGERIGTEREMAEHFGVSRSALRRALETLERNNQIHRVMGRAGGVFVSDGKIERQLNTIQGLPDLLKQQGYTSDTEVLGVRLATATAEEARNLQVRRDSTVVTVLRRRMANGIQWSLDFSVLPATLVPEITTHDLSVSLYRILREVYQIEISEADESIETVGATEEQAITLRIEPGDPLLLVRRVAKNSSGEVVEFARDFFRADRTRVHFRRYGPRWKRLSGQ